VNGVSFDIHEKEAVAIVGESGCGKSVTMMSILGLIPIPPGEIAGGKALFLGRDLLQMKEKELEAIRGREIGMIFQDPMTSLNPVLTIELQLTEALKKHYDLDDEQAAVRAVEMMEMVGIPDPARRLGDYPHQFSGGMRQRVMIAMALACEPELLIADEPTTALDVTIQAQILELLADLQHRLNLSVVLITHDLGVVAQLCHRVAVMYGGEIQEVGPAEEIFERPIHPYTQGLLRATPRLDQVVERMMAIDGTPPDLISPLPGCAFASRCQHATDGCAHRRTGLSDYEENRQVSCWCALQRVI
jgi:oligopeptide/dipeptide ABC transporter ATP-binding protein